MYNLIRFLVRYHLFFFFLLMEGFCFFLIYQNSQYHQASFVNMANEVNGRVYKSYSGVTDYLYLKQFSDSLVKENASLHARLLESKSDNTVVPKEQTDTLTKKMEQVYTYIPAKVIRNSVNQSANYIYINRGKNQGITPQMGVIDPSGVVGQVINVSDNYAAVMSLLNKKFQVSVKLKGSNYFGPLSWEGKNTTLAKLKEIPKHVKMKVGDTLVTSGYSELFPENVMVGTVKRMNAEPEENFLDIDVALSTNMNNLSYVYVVTNLKKKELLLLDSVIKK
ncbi:MAG: rod shape-determining protein MreC [Bacteroidetes bacterium]|nr:rod shape-determining protein MreC [Bacteroidota bacterium]